MIKIFSITFLLLILNSCKERFEMTDKYVYSSNGFREGLTIESFISKNLDSNGKPQSHDNPQIVTILIPQVSKTEITKKLFFLEKNSGYKWEYRGNYYDTLPLEFKPNIWYELHSHDFKRNDFSGSEVTFYFHIDDLKNKIIIKDTIYKPW